MENLPVENYCNSRLEDISFKLSKKCIVLHEKGVKICITHFDPNNETSFHTNLALCFNEDTAKDVAEFFASKLAKA